MFFTQALKHEAGMVLQEAPEMVVQRLMAGRHALIPDSYVDQIRGIRGVSRVHPRLWGYYYDTIFGANYTLIVPEEFPYRPGEIGIGSGVAEVSRSEIGNILPFWSDQGELTSFEVREILPSSAQLVAADLILISETDFRQLFAVPEGYATDIVLSVRNPRELAVIAGKIKELLPDTRPITRDELLRTYESVFDWRSGLLIAILFGSVAAFIIFAWDKASGLSAEERYEIGILKAIGWDTAEVLQMKFWEGLSVSLSAFLCGVLAAYGHVFFTSSFLFSGVLKGWGVLYPEFRLTPYIDPYQVVTIFILSVVPYTVATIVPSWRAATINPDTVLRT